MTREGRRILSLLDLTSLNETDTDASISALCHKAVTRLGAVAAVCVYPRFVALAKKSLAGTGVRVATVANFPAGEACAAAIAEEAHAALHDGADEVDVVLPYGAFLDGHADLARDVLKAARQACGGAVLKVILESGAFPERAKLADACRLAVDCGTDFLKTSTGKRQPGATLDAAEVMLEACRNAGRRVGFKASGGVRDADTAQAYLALADRVMGTGWVTPATFRFGASGLLDAVLAGTPLTSPSEGEVDTLKQRGSGPGEGY
ncbi:MAG: deoxyribose-phosphate aldolase [Pseudomonadota bacterium]|nr:deoxyribose-phosphate aldolase [Pseudomonadota bacterium]